MLNPVLKKWNHEGGFWQWGLMPEDFMKVEAGYACARCLEEFEHWVSECPVCKEPNLATYSELPPEWKGY